ncbi:hypothetical protein [Bibersteinia trehalosi]|uniref:hypothetical protein n=1 Tax=Bibersteinia trehalosi TaxID=47735 RepID=UPI00404587CC
MKKLISFFLIIFLNPAVFANVDTPYPAEMMKFFGCGHYGNGGSRETMTVLEEYRKTLNPFPEPSSRKGSSNKPEVIAYRQEAERIREMFQKKEEAYCAAKNPISSYEDIVKLPISDFANILQQDYFYGNQFAFNSMAAILDSEFGNGFMSSFPSQVADVNLGDAAKCPYINYEQLQENLVKQYGKRNLDQVNAVIKQVKSRCASILQVKTGDLIETYVKQLKR